MRERAGKITYEDEGKSFDPACHGTFFSQDITQSVDREGLCDCACCRKLLGEVVKSVGDGGIFHDIALVQNIRSRTWHFDIECVGIRSAWLG